MIKILPLSSVITANMSTSSTGIFKGQEMGLRGGGAGPGAAANHGRASIQRSEVQVSQAGSKRSRKRRSAPGDLSSGPVGSGQAGGGGPATKRRLKQRRRKRANSNAVAPISRAPFNSTQFLMSDHQRGGEDSALEYLDVALGPVGSRASSERVEAAALAVAKRKATRPRESSFSLDSDEDHYYSSPEDEEEFVCQEFIKEYNSVRTRSLVDMSKADLIKEYLQMEQRVDNLERRVDRHRGKQQPVSMGDDSSSTTSTSSNSSPPNVATVVEQIKQFQREIHRLETENEKLRATNSALVQHSKQTDNKPAGQSHGAEDESGSDSDCSTCSSSSSSSDSDSSDSGSDSESEEEGDIVENEITGEETNETEETETPKAESRRVPQQGQQASNSADQVKRKEGETDKETDTGYESSNSGSNKSSLKKNELISSTTNSV